MPSLTSASPLLSLPGAVPAEAPDEGVAAHYGSRASDGVIDGWLVDSTDADLVGKVESLGIACRAVPLMMTDPDTTAAMAVAALELVR